MNTFYKIVFWSSWIFFSIVFLFRLYKNIQFYRSLYFISNNNIYCSKYNCSPTPSSILFQSNYSKIYDFHKYSYDTASYCLQLINDVYLNDVDIPYPFQLLLTLHYQQTQIIGYILQHSINHQLWIVYRGTMNIKDVLEDVKTSQSKLNNQYNVYSGILDIYQQFRDTLLSFLKNQKKIHSIIITGHSLGGGLSILTTFDLLDKYQIITYTFGSPRIGDDSFCKEFQNKLQLHHSIYYRIQNSCDIVPFFPLPITINLIHPRQPFFYNHVGYLIEFNDNRYSYLNNHSIYTYMENLSSIL